MTYTLDTNIVIHLLKDTVSVVTQYDESISSGIPIIIPPYADFEILWGLKYAKATAKERIYQRLCDSCKIGEMRREIWVCATNLYVNLRRNGFTVGDADILIAAFCLENGYILVTNNTKYFINMGGLRLVNWVV